MRYFEKKPTEQQLALFQEWKDENQEAIIAWIANPEKTGDMLWAELGKTFGIERATLIDAKIVRNQLETTLFDEQNGLCCYCGNSIERKRNESENIWEYLYRAIEHFEAKNKIQFKAKTFDYENLLLCCKESQRLTIFEVGRTYKGSIIGTFDDVARYTDLPISTLKEHPKNAEIIKRHLKRADKIQVPNPPHCDDAKSAFDSNPEHTSIINPSTDKKLIEKLIFLSNGEISYLNRTTTKEDIIENTFSVLALNCKTLVERRQEKWLNSFITYNTEEGILFGIEDRDTLFEIINKLIEGKSQPNNEGVLEAFYFVEIAYLQSLFNGY